MPGPTSTSHVCEITALQAAQLKEILAARGWELGPAPYAFWKAQKEKTSIVAYQSGKLTVQGKGMAEFVQFILEPEILGEARFGYETEWREKDDPAMFEPHAGIDESGKGDYFGPLVVACCYTDRATVRPLLDIGVTDSKAIKDDRRIAALAGQIRTIVEGRFNIIAIGPESYNRLYGKFGNLNRLLAWGHAKALETLLEKVPGCPRAISDQFGAKGTVQRALQEKGRNIVLDEYPKAEADIAVAAASILARAEFVQRLELLGHQAGMELPKGAGPLVDAAAKALVARDGPSRLPVFAKLHFKTPHKILSMDSE